jgi:hypothetical protein
VPQLAQPDSQHVTGAFRSAYRQDRHGQSPRLALFVLRASGVDRAVEVEAAV